MKRLGLLVLLLCALPAHADSFTLKDGSTLEGTLVASTDDTYVIKLADGTTRKLAKSDVTSRDVKPVAPAAPGAQAPAVPVARPAELTAEERLAALKKAAREGLSLRARLVVGARELATWVPLRVEGGYALSAQPRKLELDQASFLDRSLDEVAHDLWERRARPPEERFRALKLACGTVCWADAAVLSAAPASEGVTEAVIEWKTVVLRGKTRLRVTDPDSMKPHTAVRIPVVLLVRQEEGAQFLAGAMGDSVSVWPLDFVALAAEVGVNGRAPTTVAADLAVRVGERTVAEAVKTWYTLRTRIACHACHQTKKCPCGECHGAGGVWKDFIAVSGGTTVIWVPCPICKGQGFHTCALCKDGLDEYVLKESLKRYGIYGQPLGGFLLEGQKIAVEKDGKAASVTTWIREKATDQPTAETLRWVVDEKSGTWRPAS